MAEGDQKDLAARVAELERQLAEEREEAEWDLKAAKEASAAQVKKLEEELAALRQAGSGGSDEVLTQRALMAERKVAELQEELKRARELAPSDARPAEDSLLRQRAEAAEQERDDLRRDKRALQRTLDERERALKRAEDKAGNTAELKRQLEEARRDLLAKERELSKARTRAAEGEKGEVELERLGRELTEARQQLEEKEEFLAASQGRVRELADEVDQLKGEHAAAEKRLQEIEQRQAGQEQAGLDATAERAELEAELSSLKEELARTRMASGQMLEQRERETARLKDDLSTAQEQRQGADRSLAELKAKAERLEKDLAVAQQERDEAVSALRRFRDGETTAVGKPPEADPFDEQTQRVPMDQVSDDDRSRDVTQPGGPPAVDGAVVAGQAAPGQDFPQATTDSQPPEEPKPFAKGETEHGEPPMPTPDEGDLGDQAAGEAGRDAVVEAFERQAGAGGDDEMPTPEEPEAGAPGAPEPDPPQAGGEQAEVDQGASDQAVAVEADWMDEQVDGDGQLPPERTAEIRSLRGDTTQRGEPLPTKGPSKFKLLVIGGIVLGAAGLLIVGALVFFPRWFGTEGVTLDPGEPQAVAKPDAGALVAAAPDAGPQGEEPTPADVDAGEPDAGQVEPDQPDEDEVEPLPARSPKAQRALEKAWAKARKLIKRRKYRPALRLLVRWVKKEPEEPVLRFLYGQALYRSRKTRQAATQLEKAVALDPDYAEAWYNLGGVYIKLRKKAEARQALNRFLELSPDDRRAKAVKKNLKKI